LKQVIVQRDAIRIEHVKLLIRGEAKQCQPLESCLDDVLPLHEGVALLADNQFVTIGSKTVGGEA